MSIQTTATCEFCVCVCVCVFVCIRLTFWVRMMFCILLTSVLALVDSLNMSCGEQNGMQKDLVSH